MPLSCADLTICTALNQPAGYLQADKCIFTAISFIGHAPVMYLFVLGLYKTADYQAYASCQAGEHQDGDIQRGRFEVDLQAHQQTRKYCDKTCADEYPAQGSLFHGKKKDYAYNDGQEQQAEGRIVAAKKPPEAESRSYISVLGDQKQSQYE